MPKNKDRIIIDTNLWISFLLTSNFPALDKLLSKTGAILLFSNRLLEEFTEVSQRPKFKKYFTLEDIQILLTQINKIAEFIEVRSNIEVCRDPKDNFLLSLAKDGLASHLITGDKDLLDLGMFGETKILTISKYLERK